ncbi:MAG: ABC transporter permease [Sporichthyaceae bacterium]
MSEPKAPHPARRAFDYWWIQHRQWWRVGFVVSLLSPTLYLAAMGFGVGGLVDDGSGREILNGTSYLDFLAPGLLAAIAMQTAMGESSWPIGNAVRWSRSYHAMIATPLRPRDVMAGQLFFVAFRVGLGAAAFLVVATAFGAWGSPWIVLGLPAAVLCGLAHAAPTAAFAVGRKHDHAYAGLQRFVIIPMFLFSGAFFPVTQLPEWGTAAAYATPLWHGVSLCRDLSGGQAEVGVSLGHAGYLGLWLVVGAVLAARAHAKALVA